MSSAKEWLEALVRSNDGFVIAEDDLRIRGPGEFFSLRQSQGLTERFSIVFVLLMYRF